MSKAPAGQVITVDAANAGRRLDAYLRKVRPEVPLAALMRWIRTGVVRLNGRKAKPDRRLSAGDTLGLPPANAPVAAAPTKARRKRLPAPKIIYEDDDLIIAFKPAGLACHAGTGHEDDSLAARIAAYLHAEHAAPGHRPGLAQRLDRGVSGLIPVGKHAAALRALAAAGTAGKLDKMYTALVAGRIRRKEGVINVPLRVDDQPMGNLPRTVPDEIHGKPAHTAFRVAARFADATLVEVRIRTGRTHQIRAHMRALGHPLLGDPRYGMAARNAPLRETYGLDRPFLHAGLLQLDHPMHGEPMQFLAPLPADLQRVVNSLTNLANSSSRSG